MFDMTNDSDMFETPEALEAAGAYRVAGNRYKRGDDDMGSALPRPHDRPFDHRANTACGYNPESEHNRPY